MEQPTDRLSLLKELHHRQLLQRLELSLVMESMKGEVTKAKFDTKVTGQQKQAIMQGYAMNSMHLANAEKLLVLTEEAIMLEMEGKKNETGNKH